jgi:LAO/AO transport system kinase
MVLCEAAGYTHIFIETVGVGQSEVAVAQLVDCFLFLAMPGTGDELQGIKKGIMEKADLIVVNKNDGANLSSAKRTKMELARALQLTMHANFDWIPPVVLASGIMKTGFNEVEDAINRFFRHSMAQGWFEENRKNQNKYWFETSVLEGMLALFQSNENWRKEHEHYMSEVSKGAISPFEASRKLLKIIK